MSWWLCLVIAAPLLFVIGTVISALKEQEKLEKGPLKKVLEERRRQNEALQKQQKKNG